MCCWFNGGHGRHILQIVTSGFVLTVTLRSLVVEAQKDVLSSLTATGSGSKLVVMTEEGVVMGRREAEGVKTPFYAFRGIPYAEPPLGDLRFQSPEKLKPWQGIKMTMEYKRSCLSYLMRLILGDEDCLYLNLFVPETSVFDKPGKLLPVVFWIHGGGLIQGSEVTPFLYHPRTFTDRGVIFVSMNYRLGPLGFLSMDDEVLPGNYGFKDMVMALKWVRANIRRFGGDPDQVHLMGQSSGGMAVHALSLSPMAKGLFSTAISMSGTLMMMSSLNPQGRPMAKRLARYLDCPADDSRRMLQCFNHRGAKELTLGIREFFFIGLRYGTPFAGVVDYYAKDPFLPEHPLKIIREGRAQPVPFIFGSMPYEMNMFLPGILYDDSNYNKLMQDWQHECGRLTYPFLYFSEIIPNPEDTAKMCMRAKDTYFEDGQMNPDGSSERFARFAGDMFIRAGTYASALLHAKYSPNAPVYYYSADHIKESPLGFTNLMNKLSDDHFHMVFSNATSLSSRRLDPNRAHTDELFLLFDPPGLQQLPPSDLAFKDWMASMFASYWFNGKPSAKGMEWPLFNNSTQEYLSFLAKPRVERILLPRERLELFANWFDLYQLRAAGDLPPSLSEMLGFQRPQFVPPAGPINRNIISRKAINSTESEDRIASAADQSVIIDSFSSAVTARRRKGRRNTPNFSSSGRVNEGGSPIPDIRKPPLIHHGPVFQRPLTPLQPPLQGAPDGFMVPNNGQSQQQPFRTDFNPNNRRRRLISRSRPQTRGFSSPSGPSPMNRRRVVRMNTFRNFQPNLGPRRRQNIFRRNMFFG